MKMLDTLKVETEEDKERNEDADRLLHGLFNEYDEEKRIEMD